LQSIFLKILNINGSREDFELEINSWINFGRGGSGGPVWCKYFSMDENVKIKVIFH
jgi:hypothetical protein